MRWRGCCLLLITCLADARSLCVFAQVAESSAITEPPRYFLDYTSLLRRELSMIDTEVTTATRTARLQMFRMPSGFQATPLSLVPDEDPPLDDSFARIDNDNGIVQITVGNHVPYLDMPKTGDPGGFGYYKVHTQVQIFDFGPSSVSFTVQAVTPMSLQVGGVGSGRTIVSPNLACFHDLGDGAAIHAFVGQQFATDSRIRDQLSTSMRCGLAVQHPLPFTTCSADQGVFLFVQALGEYRADRSDVRSTTWDVIPGIQYRLNNACWMSMGISRYQFLSCVWQY